ncbi:hypothetical protein EW146_g9867 [Bondarzewia mesenterica]|uniref:F-box domain-containing protein n=1 Tax=Bondarzewia mesenterica TaxID=1095465 RepID=A0A4S4L2L4_9AGAM|nr:hypothetical protein EW146_g9867 [Bondarzewia mesenterica]
MSIARTSSMSMVVSGILGLPVETLSHIFSVLTIMSPVLVGRAHGYSNLGWIVVTHVCRHWRQVALRNPLLWTEIDTSLIGRARMEIMAEFFSRSQRAPVNLFHRFPIGDSSIDVTPSLDEQLLLLSEHLSHVKVLDLSCVPGSLEMVADRLRAPAPLLESLTLQTYLPRDTVPGFKVPVFALGLSSGDAPKLRSAHLDGLLFPWACDAMKFLTRLNIQLPYPSPYDPADTALPSYEQLLAAIESMPHLKVLLLSNCLPLHPSEESVPPDAFRGRVIHLPRLATLSLEGPVLSCASIASCFSFPASTRIHLGCPADDNHAESFRHLLRIIAKHYSGGAAPLRTLIVLSATNFVQVRAWRFSRMHRGRPIFNDLTTKRPPALSLSWTWQMDAGWDTVRMMDAICTGLPLEGLGTLSVYGGMLSSSWTAQTWLDLFGRSQNLKHLRSVGTEISYLPRALVMPVIPREQLTGNEYLAMLRDNPLLYVEARNERLSRA